MSSEIWRRMRESVRRTWTESVLGRSEGDGANPAPVEAADLMTSVHGLHRILRYDVYDPSTGLFFNDDSIGMCFEVIPQTGADEDMVRRLTTLFTPIPSDCGIQWCLIGCPSLEDEMQRYLDLRHVALDQGKTIPLFTELAQRRIEYIQRDKGRPLWPNENFVTKRIELVFSLTKAGSREDERLVEEMAELRETMQSSLGSAHLPASSLDADGLIRILWPILNPETMFAREDTSEVRYDEGRSIKDQVTALGHHVRVRTNELVFGLAPSAPGDGQGPIAMRGFGVLQYPKRRELWQMINVIGSAFDEKMQYPCPFVICGGIFTLDPVAVNTKAQLKGARTKQNAKSKMAEFQPELRLQAEDWDIVLHQLNDGGSMCEVYHTLLLFAPKQSINKVSQVALNLWRREQFVLYPMKMLHLSALYASLPMTLTEGLRSDLKKLRLMSTKTTVNAVDMSPVIGEWQGAGEPVLMFFGRRGTPTFLDFYSNQQGNYNIFVCGVSGSGKSVVMNEIVSAYRSVGARVWVIDIGRSYRNLVSLQKGTFLEFTAKGNMCINPFTWIGADDDMDIDDEMRMLKPQIARMSSPDAAVSAFQYALIEEAIRAVWKDYGTEANPTLIRDYLIGKIKNESGGTERVAYELGKQLLPFTKEGVYGKFYNGRANISLDADMVGLELEELKNAPGLRRVVLLTLTSRIAHDMYLSRDRKKLCLVDEAWQLVGDDKESAEFIEEGNRRARKYDGMFCVGTQGIEDAYRNAAMRSRAESHDENVHAWASPDKRLGEGRANPAGVTEDTMIRDGSDALWKAIDKVKGGDGTADGEALNENKKRNTHSDLKPRDDSKS